MFLFKSRNQNQDEHSPFENSLSAPDDAINGTRKIEFFQVDSVQKTVLINSGLASAYFVSSGLIVFFIVMPLAYQAGWAISAPSASLIALYEQVGVSLAMSNFFPKEAKAAAIGLLVSLVLGAVAMLSFLVINFLKRKFDREITNKLLGIESVKSGNSKSTVAVDGLLHGPFAINISACKDFFSLETDLNCPKTLLEYKESCQLPSGDERVDDSLMQIMQDIENDLTPAVNAGLVSEAAVEDWDKPPTITRRLISLDKVEDNACTLGQNRPQGCVSENSPLAPLDEPNAQMQDKATPFKWAKKYMQYIGSDILPSSNTTSMHLDAMIQATLAQNAGSETAWNDDKIKKCSAVLPITYRADMMRGVKTFENFSPMSPQAIRNMSCIPCMTAPVSGSNTESPLDPMNTRYGQIHSLQQDPNFIGGYAFFCNPQNTEQMAAAFKLCTKIPERDALQRDNSPAHKFTHDVNAIALPDIFEQAESIVESEAMKKHKSRATLLSAIPLVLSSASILGFIYSFSSFASKFSGRPHDRLLLIFVLTSAFVAIIATGSLVTILVFSAKHMIAHSKDAMKNTLASKIAQIQANSLLITAMPKTISNDVISDSLDSSFDSQEAESSMESSIHSAESLDPSICAGSRTTEVHQNIEGANSNYRTQMSLVDQGGENLLQYSDPTLEAGEPLYFSTYNGLLAYTHDASVFYYSNVMSFTFDSHSADGTYYLCPQTMEEYVGGVGGWTAENACNGEIPLSCMAFSASANIHFCQECSLSCVEVPELQLSDNQMPHNGPILFRMPQDHKESALTLQAILSEPKNVIGEYHPSNQELLLHKSGCLKLAVKEGINLPTTNFDAGNFGDPHCDGDSSTQHVNKMLEKELRGDQSEQGINALVRPNDGSSETGGTSDHNVYGNNLLHPEITVSSHMSIGGTNEVPKSNGDKANRSAIQDSKQEGKIFTPDLLSASADHTKAPDDHIKVDPSPTINRPVTHTSVTRKVSENNRDKANTSATQDSQQEGNISTPAPLSASADHTKAPDDHIKVDPSPTINRPVTHTSVARKVSENNGDKANTSATQDSQQEGNISTPAPLSASADHTKAPDDHIKVDPSPTINRPVTHTSVTRKVSENNGDKANTSATQDSQQEGNISTPAPLSASAEPEKDPKKHKDPNDHTMVEPSPTINLPPASRYHQGRSAATKTKNVSAPPVLPRNPSKLDNDMLRPPVPPKPTHPSSTLKSVTVTLAKDPQQGSKMEEHRTMP